MSNRFLVSVIIPTYNRCVQVQRAIESVLDQTYKKFEIIVVDGPSTDGTEKVIKNIDDERIKYIRNDTKCGAPRARNIGVNKANGEYVAFLDSDDQWMPSKLEKQIELIKRSDSHVAAVYCDYYTNYIDLNVISKNNRLLYEGDIYGDLLSGKFYLITSVLLIKRDIFLESGGFDSNLPYFEDYDFCLKIAQNHDILVVDQPLVIKNVGYSDSLSRDNDIKIGGLDMMIDRWGAQMVQYNGPDGINNFRNNRLTRYLFFNSIGCIRNNNRQKAIHEFINYLRHSPIVKSKHIVYFVCSLIGGPIIEKKLIKLYTLYRAYKS